MHSRIIAELEAIENEYGVSILFAAESGSRAWGFASPDSDYDVRFVYARRREDYLRLETVRDVIDWTPEPLLDMTGWDLPKAMRLMRKSNPSLYEWVASPIVYMRTQKWEELAPARVVRLSVGHFAEIPCALDDHCFLLLFPCE